jgi:hypothetical protein
MWNYRIIKDKKTYGLYEVFYNDDGEITAHSEEPEIIGESPRDLLDILELMISDVNEHIIHGKKILKSNKIKFAPMYDEKDLGEAMTLEEFKKTIE